MGRIVESKKGDCASEELSQPLMYTRVDLYNIRFVPIRDLDFISRHLRIKVFVLGYCIPHISHDDSG